MNWPNRLTLLRIILVPVFVALIMYQKLPLAFVVFVIASLTDALDGYLARVLDQKTKFGAILDPLADKMLIISAFICFSIVTGIPEYLKMPVYVPIIIISRDVFILLGAMVTYLTTGHLDVKPTILGKLTTCIQMATIISLLLQFPYSYVIWNTAVLFSVLSGIDYVRIASYQINGKV